MATNPKKSRASNSNFITLETTKGNMTAIIDGYNAPLTAGAFVDLSLKGFYDGLPFSRAFSI